ncbi:MAG: FtsX-like permease family protein [bacterium]|nr:FtsX-like permease family protein [bacterium]
MNKKLRKPPGAAKYLLKLLVRRSEHYSYFGDIEEMFNEYSGKKGHFNACFWYWSQALKLIPGYIADSIIWSLTMFKNYFKTGIRNLLRNKTYSFINIFGFAVGIAACILIFLVANFVLSYDSFHENIDEIYFVYRDMIYPSGSRQSYTTQLRLKEELDSTFPEVRKSTRFYATYPSVRYGEFQSNDEVAYVDPSFLEIFSFDLIKGDISTACRIKNNVVISRRIAEKYFGDEDPIGKVLNINFNEDFIVNGVIETTSSNSSIWIDILAPIENVWSLPQIKRWDEFSSSFVSTYVMVDSKQTADELESRMPSIVKKHFGEDGPETLKYGLMPFGEYHASRTNDEKYAMGLLALAAAVIIIAIMNYVNLTTAKSMYRTREIGMRKVLGAKKIQLIKQIMIESVIISGIAASLGIIIVESVIPVVNDFLNFEVNTGLTDNPANIFILLAFGMGIGIISGVLPALFFAREKPIVSLKGNVKGSSLGVVLRNVFVSVQFTFSVTLIIAAIVIWSQLDYMKNCDMGFNNENLISMRLGYNSFSNTEKAKIKIESFKNELRGGSNIVKVASSLNVPGVNSTGFRTNAVPNGWSEENEFIVNLLTVDENYFSLYMIDFLEGRDFSLDNALDRQGKTIIINETMYNMIGEPGIVGNNISVQGRDYQVAGVIKDYNFRSLHEEITPLVFYFGEHRNINPDHITIRFNDGNGSEALEFAQNTWERIFPDKEFSYFYVDERFRSLYDTDEKLGTVSGWFSVISIVLASLGLYGLFSFTVVKRTKEVGVRKVLGATGSQIVGTLSGKFILLILVSNVIAWPAAYYIMGQWLQLFAYKTNISLLHFLFSGAVVFIIAFLTIFLQAVKASLNNPVDALRYE